MDDFYAWTRSLRFRRTSNGWLGGICGGIAHITGIDVTLVRAAMLLLLIPLSLGIMVVAYVIAWLLLPDENERIPLQDLFGKGADTASATPVNFTGSAPTYVNYNNGGEMKENTENSGPETPGEIPGEQTDDSVESTNTEPGGSQQPGGSEPKTEQIGIEEQQPYVSQAAPTYTATAPPYNPAAVRHTTIPGVQPPRVRRPGPGQVTQLFAVGLSIIAVSLTVALTITGRIFTPAGILLGGATVTLILAAAAFLSHLRKRNGTWMTAFATVLAVLLLPGIIFLAIPESGYAAGGGMGNQRSYYIGDQIADGNHPLDSEGYPEPDYTFQVGGDVLQLPPADAIEPNATYSVTGQVGSIELNIPEGIRATVKLHVGVGNAEWQELRGGTYTRIDTGIGNNCHWRTGYIRECTSVVGDPAGVPVTVNLSLDIGKIEINSAYETNSGTPSTKLPSHSPGQRGDDDRDF